MIWGKLKEEVEFPTKLIVLDKVLDVDLTFSKKRSSSASIKGTKLVFRMSSYLSKKQALKDFNELFLSIKRKIEKSPEMIEEDPIEKILEKGYFYFSGERYTVERKMGKRGVKLVSNTFFVPIEMKNDLVKKSFLKHLRERYYSRLQNYVLALNSSTYNYKIKDFELKVIESKWGHCTHDNIILLNMKLLNARKEVLDYVIFHEISHIRHKNHSLSFWNEVSRFCPNYKELRKELKTKPPKLFIIDE